MNPRHPVYVISKGRWESRQTHRALTKLRVPHSVVVEPHEEAKYRRVLDPIADLKVLPFSNLGQGSIPARNWVWEDSIDRGAKWHWILDDNIMGFYRLNRNFKTTITSGTIFYAAEEFCERYENVGQGGFNYWMFAPRKAKVPPLYVNTRVYSCILLRNDLDLRWRGRYNEDTDLSLRILKSGLSTILFNAFLADKSTTMSMKGGNTDELYKDDGRRQMAQSLVDQHPDVARVSFKWGRYQHHVDYSPFRRNRPRLRPGLEIPEGVNNFGMVYQWLENGAWLTEGFERVQIPQEQIPLFEDTQLSLFDVA
jgi:hypothetical protein